MPLAGRGDDPGMTRIVVGLDGSDDAAVTLRWAAREARLRGHKLTAVMAWGYPEQFRGIGRFEPHAGQRAASRALDALIHANLSEEDAAGIERAAVDGFAAEVLLDAAQHAELLVVGSRGRGGFLGLRLGSVSEQCLEHAACPVAIVRLGREGTGPRIVVGYDGSDASWAALRWALDEGRLRQAPVDVVHAWAVPIAGTHPFSVAAFDPVPFEQAASHMLEAAVEASDTTGLPAPVGRLAVCEPPVKAILDAAVDAELIVLGSRGLGGFKELLLGSVAHQVAHHATCPVVVHRAI